ncbi:MAG: hypothetical protein K9I94_10790 [Bacteroidales bacterium]|nr:hypothetical protein [Bacteroidales bacterium]
MNIKPIHTEHDYEEALKRMEAIFDAPKGTPESDEADILGLLIEEYESKNYPMNLSTDVLINDYQLTK